MHISIPEGPNLQTSVNHGNLLPGESEKHQRFAHITEAGCCTPKQAKNREITGDQYNPNSGLKDKKRKKKEWRPPGHFFFFFYNNKNDLFATQPSPHHFNTAQE